MQCLSWTGTCLFPFFREIVKAQIKVEMVRGERRGGGDINNESEKADQQFLGDGELDP